jgi:hypothetical protein
MKKILLTLLSFCAFTVITNAQSWDDQSWDDSGDGDGWGTDDGSTDGSSDASGDYDYDPSGANAGSFDDSTGSDDGWGDDGGWDDDGGSDWGGQEYVRSARPKIEARPYERFVGMPYDSAAQLVTFVEIVEVIVPDRFLDLGGDDYSLSDSLYARAMVWMEKQFGKKEAKKMIEESGLDPDGKEGNTIKALVTMPLTVQVNKYQKENAGTIRFDMELRFKDERYRYKFNNFVHITPNRSGGKGDEETYMEYYMTAKKNIRTNDKVLMACNAQMNRMIDDLKATCEATPFIDDDDW